MAVPCCNNVEIERVKTITKEDFDKFYLKEGVPVVIEQGIEHWPARHWTLDSLCERVGDNKVNVRVNTDCLEYKLGQQYRVTETTFGAYVKDLKAGNKRSKNSYLAVQNLRKALLQIQDDVIVPDFVGKLHGGPYLWIAHPGHYEYCHYDPDDGLLVMISGSKRVRLFGCDVTPMYPNTLGSKGRTVQATVDCDAPDLDKHPAFQGITCHHCWLQPGEMLYIPAFWWHQVTSVDMAISVNMFWGNAGDNEFLTKVMAPPVWGAFSHWLLNIIEQNRPYPSFERSLARLPEALRQFLINQWHEHPTDQQLEVLVTLIMQHLAIDELPKAHSGGKFPPPIQIRGLLWRS